MPEPVEKKLQETCDKIEKGLEDIKNNKASKQEVLDLIDERIETDKAAVAQLQERQQEVAATMEEVKELAANMTKQLKRLGRNDYEALKDQDGGWNGIFRSPHDAKIFGLFVLAGAGRAAGKATKALKILDDMGIDVNWLNEDGKSINFDTKDVKAMTGSSMTGGSALVSIETIPNLIAIQERYSKFRANTTVYPMGSSSSMVPKLSSGLTVYCPGEGGTITQSAPTIAVLNLLSKTWLTLTAIGLDLEADSAIAIGELIGGQILQAFGKQEDMCGFLGDGTSTYFGHTGIVGALNAVDSDLTNIYGRIVGSGDTFGELVIGDFEKVVGVLPEIADDGRAKWFVHRYFYATIMVKLALAQSGATAMEVINGAGVREKNWLSYPVEFVQVMPKATAISTICAIFGNLTMGSYLGTRGGVEIAESDQRYFDQGLLAIRGKQRVAINVHGVGTAADADAPEAGPICALATAAS